MTRSRLVAVTAVMATVALVGGAGIAAASQQARVMPGIFVAGIRLEGLPASEVVRRLDMAARIAENRPISMQVGDRVWVRTARDFGIKVDIPETAKRVMSVGRQNPLSWLFHTLDVRETQLAFVTNVNGAALKAVVAELAVAVRKEASNGEIKFEEGKVVAISPNDGVELFTDEAERLLQLKVLDVRNGTLRLPSKTTPSSVTVEELERVRAQAERLLGTRVSMRLGDKTFELSATSIARTLRVVTVNSAHLVLEIDPAALREQIVAAAPFAHTEPKDARFVVVGDKVRVEPGAKGKTIDAETAAESLLATVIPAPIELREVLVDPELTTEEARALGIVERVATYTTTFDPRNAPRVSNIDLIARAIDHKLVLPGEEFSLNESTGPRTPENGYREASIIVDGELVPGIGGGVCQVATTVFNSVFSGGYEIIERTNHSLHIAQYPMGRDATVNYGFQDLRFKNDTEFGVLIKASTNSRGITVSVYSSPNGRTLETSTSETRNPKPPPTRYIDDPSLPAGQEVVVEEGKPGFDVTVTRKVLANGTVLHSDTFVSKYRPWTRVVRRGTGPAEAGSPSPGTSP